MASNYHPDMPERFKVVGTMVAVLPHNPASSDVKFGKIIKVTKTQVTVEVTSSTSDRTYTKRFYNPKYQYSRDPMFPMLPEFDAYDGDRLVTTDDPKVQQYQEDRTHALRYKELRQLMTNFTSVRNKANALLLIDALKQFVGDMEAKASGTKL